jgi:DNA-binding protein HU-beta
MNHQRKPVTGTKGVKMTKADLISELADKTSLSKLKAEECLEHLIDIVSWELKTRGSASLPNFGKLRVVDRAERNGRNPRTGEALRIPASRTVKFCPGNALKSTVQ